MNVSSEITFSISTLGCKLNQYESECLRQKIENSGLIYRSSSDNTDFCIINTCTVTGKTDARCRNAIRRARRSSPRSTVIVTGCQVDIFRETLKEMEEIDYLVSNSDKGRIDLLISEIIAGDRSGSTEGIKDFRNSDVKNDGIIRRFANHARAFIMIQNGCNAYCSYCIIPYARGRSISFPPSEIIRQIRTLVSNGYEEIILTGIHIGRYGEGCAFNTDLTELLKMILDQTEGARIRLSSIEPNEIDRVLVELVSSTDRIAPHFHIPLQSGDNSILERMNRRYRAEEYKETIQLISENVDNVCIGADVIVGFPGEKSDNFEKTHSFLEEMSAVNYLHVFSYSDRPGTRAAEMPEKINPKEKKKRSSILIDLSGNKRSEFLKSQPGGERLAIILQKSKKKPGWFRGITGNYCNVLIRGEQLPVKKLLPVYIEKEENNHLTGRISGRPYFGEIDE